MSRRDYWSMLMIAAMVWAVPTCPAFAQGQNKNNELDEQLSTALKAAGFTGRIEEQLTKRLGRPLNPPLANIGRLLWFDTITGLNNDNSCAGCHSPTRGFGDTQPIAIGIDNNFVVGPHRAGPRNMRRSPLVINTAFYPALMWNGRFMAKSGNPFDNRNGFNFPPPEGLGLSYLPHLLTAQAFIPPTERNEVAGFTFPGDNNAIRLEVMRRLNITPNYRLLFGQVFPAVRQGFPITFDMFGAAIAEFEFSVVFADAPLDRFARGQPKAMTDDQKRGALLFFGKAGCVTCHAVAGNSNEMFSDFANHVVGVPQIAPKVTNAQFDGPKKNEDFGLEQVTGKAADRYKFRTAPLRNAALMPAYFHNGAFTTLEDAIRHHLDVRQSAMKYTPVGRLPADLAGPTGPIEPVLARLDPLLAKPTVLTNNEFGQLVEFVRLGLLDKRALPKNLARLIPPVVPSSRPVMRFEFD